MKRITKSTLSSCRVDFLALNEFCRSYPDDVVKMVLTMLHDVFNAQNIEDANVQLQLNSLESLGVLIYFDESVVPCEDSDELFGKNIPTTREAVPPPGPLEEDDYEDAVWEEPLGEEDEEEEPELDDLFEDRQIKEIFDVYKNATSTLNTTPYVDTSLFNEIIGKLNKDEEEDTQIDEDYDDLPF